MYGMANLFNSNIFKISVISTVSSGKSTFVNSIIGTDFLPSANEACTAKLITLFNSSTKNERSLLLPKADSYECITDFGNALLDKLNSDSSISNIVLKCHFQGFRAFSKPVVLIDTPGVNNSLCISHGEMTYDYISKLDSGLIIYIVNATQIGICDDRDLLDKVIDRVIARGGRLKIIFVINKADEFDYEKEQLKEILADVRKYINDCIMFKPPLSSVTADDFRIFPVSSLAAKIIRKKLRDEKITRLEKRILRKSMSFLNDEHAHFEKYASLSPQCRHYTEKCLIKAGSAEDSDKRRMKQLLIHTGIPSIEETINEYISAFESLRD